MTEMQMSILEFMYGETVIFDDIRTFLNMSKDEFESQRHYILNAEMSKCLRWLPCDPRNLELPLRPVTLSNHGEELVVQARAAKKQRRIKELREWITTIIAFLALLLSIVSLMWQAHTEKSQSTEAKDTMATTMEPGVYTANQYIW